MLRGRLLNTTPFLRCTLRESTKRFMRTVSAPSKQSPAADFGRSNSHLPADLPHTKLDGRSWTKHQLDPILAAKTQTQTPAQLPGLQASRWAKHSLDTPAAAPTRSPTSLPIIQRPGEISLLAPVRRSRTSRFKGFKAATSASPTAQESEPQQNASVDEVKTAPVAELPKVITDPAASATTASVPAPQDSTTATTKAKKPRRQLKPRKALITLTPNALENLRALLDQPEPQLIRIGVKNRGCSGLTYHLEYVSEPGKFDETVEQDGVRVVIDSKALFSIVGSEMDWIDDKLSTRFIFRNPNSKGTCGCGESFMV
ncbi:hypothetical protein METBIDRAFT_33261 [Metschnikowia bicuspidata var. bicuspidata NRRL YB-4993]|uniref:Iron-sulfur assembly protein 1 n=1 Tax=Metschnikowia bicuspidata var. bicuspidata NRRL YB-4993 TaxID=869754 RepID=A0A1A0H6S9_9ASCO|nr:hypothetical protein METBIDRAFT_33261 [Metschnikowia bicuspidata var. bicuspidata NRRL YB-4993]OBA19613.1 hypothetical protein METBIDRAFT_33261 [Metschnikowia bicuspidata var. bicuspidata NRRL YB-4993]